MKCCVLRGCCVCSDVQRLPWVPARAALLGVLCIREQAGLRVPRGAAAGPAAPPPRVQPVVLKLLYTVTNGLGLDRRHNSSSANVV